MNILAIDTTTKKATVALRSDDKIFLKEVDNEITHSEKLLPLLDEVLKDASMNIKDLDLFALTLGPGSFTGVRIGIATVKALAKVTNKKIFGTTSLELLALDGIKKSHSTPEYVLALMDARNKRAYYNLYKYENSTLTSIDFSGNNYVEEILLQLNNKKLDNVLIVADSPNLDIKEAIVANLDLNNIFTLDMTKNLYTYLDLDAMYYRKSEAERTKEGE